MNEGFALDPRLAADTASVAELPLSRLLLMDDARFPWLILVPRRPGLVELADLDRAAQHALLDEVQRAGAALRAAAPCDKLNVGALGNVVRQLHVHVVARRAGDAAWPGPVWGAGRAERYAADAREALLARLRALLG
ncbi:MAG: HIT family protein [Mizugakiibacter sp.]|uniref:HIT family protein n=1 Tax=Mizugakiibacter sp. TaxID=1972610 RepID=UPI0031BE1C23|nr:HIT family protein [Xanthomonadaceae bacterium]